MPSTKSGKEEVDKLSSRCEGGEDAEPSSRCEAVEARKPPPHHEDAEDRKPPGRDEEPENSSQHVGDASTGAMREDTASRLESERPCRSTSSHNSKIIMSPHPDDILMGRGWTYQQHPGNKKMWRIVKEHKERYGTLSRVEKGDLVKKLLRLIRKSGARFLKKAESVDIKGWEVATKGEAYAKVCHALRGKPRENKRGSRILTDPTSDQSAVAHSTLNSHARGPTSSRSDHPECLVEKSSCSKVARLETRSSKEAQHATSSSQISPPSDSLVACRHPPESTVSSACPITQNLQQGESPRASVNEPQDRARARSDGDTSSLAQDADFLEDLSDLDPAIKLALSKYLRTKRGD